MGHVAFQRLLAQTREDATLPDHITHSGADDSSWLAARLRFGWTALPTQGSTGQGSRVRSEQTSEILKALADPTRLQIALCFRDAKEAVCTCDFTATFDVSQPTVSHHMAKLREAGLVEVTKKGIWSFYRLAPDLPPATRRLIEAL